MFNQLPTRTPRQETEQRLRAFVVTGEFKDKLLSEIVYALLARIGDLTVESVVEDFIQLPDVRLEHVRFVRESAWDVLHDLCASVAIRVTISLDGRIVLSPGRPDDMQRAVRDLLRKEPPLSGKTTYGPGL